jgi:hypothetical protein
VKKIALDRLREAAKSRPPGYYDAVVAAGTIEGNHVLLTDEAHLELFRRFNALLIPEPEYASLPTKAARLTAAVGHAVASGWPIVSEEERNRRGAICENCPGRFWLPEANFGLGQCTAPGCGCTKFKWWLALQACPLFYWEARPDPHRAP